MRQTLEERLEAELPRKGERWDAINRIFTVRVMADPIEGYIMARRKGGMPFLTHKSDWHGQFTRKPQA